MRSTTIYEWIVEQMDPETIGTDDPEVYETSAFDTLVEAKAYAAQCDMPIELGLVRNVGNDTEGLVDRSWAYVKDGKLPERFSYGLGADDGVAVPQRFHKEIAS